MQTSINQSVRTISPTYAKKSTINGRIGRFNAWCRCQEKHRFGWLAAALTIHGCILTPLTIMVVILSGNNLILFGLAIAAMASTLVTNLAAMPTRITIPVFLLSVGIDMLIIVNCLLPG